MRLVLFAAMAGFLTMAMAIPEVFGAGALTFGTRWGAQAALAAIAALAIAVLLIEQRLERSFRP